MEKLFTTKVKDQIFYLTIKNSENGNRVSDELAIELTQTIDAAASRSRIASAEILSCQSVRSESDMLL